MATEVLDDVALRIIETHFAPQDMPAYLIAAVSNRTRRMRRDEVRYSNLLDQSPTNAVSQHALRTVIFADDDGSLGPRSAVLHLASALRQQITEDELEILESALLHDNNRGVAARRGLRSTTVRVKLCRLRQRLRESMPAYLATLDASERHEVERFLRRAGPSGS